MSVAEYDYDDVDPDVDPDPPYEDENYLAESQAEADKLLFALGRVLRARARAIATVSERVADLTAWLEGELGLPVTVTIKPVELEKWLEDPTHPVPTRGHGGREHWLRERLRRFHVMVLSRDKKATTIKLPAGDLPSRMGQPTWEVTDEAKLLEWARAHAPEIIATREVTITVPDASVTALMEALLALDDVEGTALNVTDPRIDRATMKDRLTKRDEKGKALAHGVDPQTDEVVPGLTVHPAERAYKAEPRPLHAV